MRETGDRENQADAKEQPAQQGCVQATSAFAEECRAPAGYMIRRKAEQLRLRAKALAEQADEFDSLAKLADGLDTGSKAEQAIWNLVSGSELPFSYRRR